MNRFADLRRQIVPLVFVILIFALYARVFASYHDQLGIGIASLATIPVMVAGWFFGVEGGITLAILCIALNVSLQLNEDHALYILFSDLANIIRIVSLILVAIATGALSSITRERRDAIRKLEHNENGRDGHTTFLELLNQITASALDADSLYATLEILTEQLAVLFKAQDAFFAFWDEDREVPLPTVAYGSMKDIYPYMQFESGEITLTASVMEVNRPIPVEDIDHSPYISPTVAAVFPCRSMLGIPFTTQRHRLGAILLGYKREHSFNQDELLRAGITAEQVALVLSKSQLLEEERKRVRQLTALHDVALIAIEVDSEDELIERVTDIIGKNLFPDNFGILLLDQHSEILRPHTSYRFYLAEDLKIQDMQLGIGITGQVAKSGMPQRIGNVRRIPEYVDVDDRTISELCVPIKFKERILGVINAESTKRNAFTPEDERLLITLAGQLATAIEQLRKAQGERFILDQLAHDKDLIYSIAQISTQMEGSLDPNQILQTLGAELAKIGLTCIMASYDAKLSSFTVNYTSLPPQLLDTVDMGLGYPLVQYNFSRLRLETILKAEDLLRPGIVADPEREIDSIFTRINKKGITGLLRRIGVSREMEPLRLPLAFEGNLLGVLWLWGQNISGSDLPIMSIFAKQIGISLERARLFQEVQSLALTDPLTGLNNRRHLFELGRVEFSRAERMKRPFSCMMLDIDHFKKVNDDYGHQIGDEVLQEFARFCLASVREVDLLGRYGGEEFIILLPETSRDISVHVAERLRTRIAEHPIKTSSGDLEVTISIGVATKDEQTTNLESLIARADQALYISKHKGRNRVSISI
jgi:diguanylate cyclase (GGDEF)-like protein